MVISIYYKSVAFQTIVDNRFYIFLHNKHGVYFYENILSSLFKPKWYLLNGFQTTSPISIFSVNNIFGLTSNTQLQYNNFELNNFEIFFLRKNRVFNKGRYSRNRQNYRTGVYICFYLSIISIFGLYYTFYRFSFNFSYMWFLFFFFFGSFFFSKVLGLLSFRSVKNSIKNFLNWVFSLRF